MKPRTYQTEAVQAVLLKFLGGDQRTLVVLPTGAGKTVVAAMIGDALKTNGRIMVVAHRDELIKQAAEKFMAITGIVPAIEKADQFSDERSLTGPPPLVISSVQTLNSGNEARRRMHKFHYGDFAYLWIDEAHHAVAVTYQRVIDYFTQNKALKMLGVTATADRSDEVALGKVFQSCAFKMELPALIDDGYLVPIRQRRVRIEGLNFSKVRLDKGDLHAKDLEAALMYEKPFHGIIHALIELSCGLPENVLEQIKDDEDRASKLQGLLAGRLPKRTLIFTVSVAHAERVAEIINRWLPDSAAHVDGKMEGDKRAMILGRYRRGEIHYLVNCMIATEGFDMPEVEVVVMAKPTKSRALYTQMCGRGTRPLSDVAMILGDLDTPADRRHAITNSAKPHMEVLDFVDNSGKHKLITAIDVLGDERYDPAVIDRANEIAEDESIDVAAALARAVDDVEDEREAAALFAEAEAEANDDEDERKRQAEAARRARLVGTTAYRTETVDPFDQLDLHPDYVNSGLKRKGSATPKQVDYLVDVFGVDRNVAERYSVRQAGAVISEMKERRGHRGHR